MPAEVTPLPFDPRAPVDPTGKTAPLRTVLVVDDDDDTRAAMAELLEDRGYAVAVAENGQRAIEYLVAHPPPDCMVLDLWMPVMDGWSLATEVSLGRLPAIPILVVTAAPAQFAYPVPARYVLRKPVSQERLMLLIDELCEASRGGSAA